MHGRNAPRQAILVPLCPKAKQQLQESLSLWLFGASPTKDLRFGLLLMILGLLGMGGTNPEQVLDPLGEYGFLHAKLRHDVRDACIFDSA